MATIRRTSLNQQPPAPRERRTGVSANPANQNRLRCRVCAAVRAPESCPKAVGWSSAKTDGESPWALAKHTGPCQYPRRAGPNVGCAGKGCGRIPVLMLGECPTMLYSARVARGDWGMGLLVAVMQGP